MLPFVPTAVRPILDVPPVPVRVPTTPDVEIVRGGVLPPPPFGPPTVTVTELPPTPTPPTYTPPTQTPPGYTPPAYTPPGYTPPGATPPTSPPVGERGFVQPTPPTPAVPVYPRKQARH